MKNTFAYLNSYKDTGVILLINPSTQVEGKTKKSQLRVHVGGVVSAGCPLYLKVRHLSAQPGLQYNDVLLKRPHTMIFTSISILLPTHDPPSPPLLYLLPHLCCI